MAERTAAMKGNPLALVGPELKVGDPAPDFALVGQGLDTVTLADTGAGVRVLAVVPSLDTGVCDAEIRRFNSESADLGAAKIFAISRDLPFAAKRWCGAAGVDKVTTLSDFKSGAFGASYGVLLKDLQIHSRAIFVLDGDNTIQYVEYVPEVTDHPDYEAALAKVKELAG